MTEISELTAAAAVDSGDLFVITDVSDTTDSADGTSKKATAQTLFQTISYDILPSSDGTRDLGSASFAWAEIHTDALFVNGQQLTTVQEQETIGVEVFAPTTDVVTGDGAAYVAIPSELNTWDLVAVGATHVTAGAGGTATSIQVHNVTDSADMLSTALTVDSTELNSGTAATAAVIDTANDDVATPRPYSDRC